MSTYTATIRWSAKPGEDYAKGQYSRAHEWMFDCGVIVPASASPHIVPAPWSDAGCVDPEEAFVASLSSCHMNICAGLDFKAADAEMTRAYDAAASKMKQMDATLDRTYDDRIGYFAALLQSQRDWLKFRDSYCVVEGYYARGGSMEPMLVSGCLEQVTKQRTDQLHALIKMYND